MPWKLLSQTKQVQINHDTNNENEGSIEYGYQLNNILMLWYNQANKYKSPFKLTYKMTQMCTSIAAKLRIGATQDRKCIHWINTYNIKDFNWWTNFSCLLINQIFFIPWEFSWWGHFSLNTHIKDMESLNEDI